MRTYRIHGTEREVNEEQFSYNTKTVLNEKAKLKEIKEMVGSSRQSKKAPGTVYLRSCGNLVAAATAANCRMEIYDCGFAIYQTQDTATVLRMEYVGKCWYEGDPELELGSQSIDLSDTAWVVAVMMKGEDRLEKWRGERDVGKLVSLCEAGKHDEETGEKSELEVDAGVDIELELEEQKDEEAVLKTLTSRQRECAYMHYALGMTDREIASVLGIRHQNVNKALQGTLRKTKNYINKSEG